MKRELLIGTVTARVLDAVPEARVEWRRGVMRETWCSVTWPVANGADRNHVGFGWMDSHIAELPDGVAEHEAQRVVDIAKAGVR